MRVPEWARKSANVLFCLVAVVGIGWSGKEIWQVLSARHQIDEACAGLVPAGRVLALSPAGGTITHRDADEGTVQLDGLADGEDCEIFSTEAGEKSGSHSGERWFFTGAMGSVAQESPFTPEDPSDDLLDPAGPYSAHVYPEQPLGGGIAGTVGDTAVTVHLPCARGRLDGRPVGTLWASAGLTESESPFTERGQLTGHDRSVLAETAVTTANRLAERAGCADRLPDAPDDIPALPEGPTPAVEADGTCAWYRSAGLAEGGESADQVLESRADPRAWDERCALVLSARRASAVWATRGDGLDSVYAPDRPGRYFAAFHTYSGDAARNVRLRSTAASDTPVDAEPGEAGRDTEEPVWWASSVCAGKPRVHTLTLSSAYARVAAPAYERIFRTYVDDQARRHGCTGIAFPAKASFRADR
ncbi:hypothetical protein ABII15_20130 [Streptomyces sp. HUAS MG91]|uniref:Uncharacterized protein n=1 Tax=Streptomyces tabacisoli TaxID=3156398 RepID=A0AAU8IWD8_9ACTN